MKSCKKFDVLSPVSGAHITHALWEIPTVAHSTKNYNNYFEVFENLDVKK